MVSLFRPGSEGEFRELDQIASGLNSGNARVMERIRSGGIDMAGLAERMYSEASKGDSRYVKALLNLGRGMEAAGIYYVDNPKFAELSYVDELRRKRRYLIHELAKGSHKIAKMAARLGNAQLRDGFGDTLLGIMVGWEHRLRRDNPLNRKELPDIRS
ncbi:MAG: hypothetical protein KGH58_03555 [Candidatus Micrarchaeota archaeon]|nr:hypothetical protein [Candidatus Micrarchaeota archaeon]